MALQSIIQDASYLISIYEYERAIEKLNQALKLEPENTFILDSLSEAYLEIGQLQQAKIISFLLEFH